MADEKKPDAPKYAFTWNGEHLCGRLQHGIETEKSRLLDFEMRPCSAGDMVDAEDIASPAKFFAYRLALISVQLVRLGDLDGPIPYVLLRKAKPGDVDQLIEALDEVEREGKPESNGAEAGTTESSSSP